MYHRSAIALLIAFLALPLPLPAQTADGTLLDLARIRDGVRSKRVSSFDRTGGNNDRFESIPDGEGGDMIFIDGHPAFSRLWWLRGGASLPSPLRPEPPAGV